MSTLILERLSFPAWHCGLCEEKLMLRGQLPGASIFDRSAVSLREGLERGMSMESLLPLAMSSSWMVNNRVASPQFQGWLQPDALGFWVDLCAALQGDARHWLSRSGTERREVQQLVERLFLPGMGVVSLSKVLSLLCPVVPLMDDAALWFALDAVEYPKDANVSTSQAALFLPMLDWFSGQVVGLEGALEELSAFFPSFGWTASQVLDRLLWFESWGYHLFSGELQWRWVADGDREAVIPVSPIEACATSPSARIELSEVTDKGWCEEVKLALRYVFEPDFEG